MLSGKVEEVKGALDMAMRMIKLPVKLSPDKIKDAVSGMIEEDVNDFHVRFIRSHIMEE